MTRRPAIIFHGTPQNSTALNILLAALESRGETKKLDITMAVGRAAAAKAARAAADDGADVLVAWSYYSPDASRAARDLTWFRKRVTSPRVQHISGGPHATAEPRAVLADGFDLAALGEGELTLLELARALREQSPLTGGRGIAFLENSQYVSRGYGERIELDDFPPFPIEHRRLNPIEITRGCVYSCSFCQTPFLFKAKFRHRSVENITEHARIMAACGARYIRFLTPTSLSYGAEGEEPRLDRVEALLASVRSALGSKAHIYFGTFPSELRPEHVTPQALAMLKRYVSNSNLVIGGQSGSDRVLSANRRGHTRDDVVRAVRYCAEAGFLANVDFLFGLPGEEPDDVNATVSLAQELAALGARIHAHTFMPLPGTPTRDAPPGRMSSSTRLALDRLVAGGRAYGQWKEQALIARRLARARASAATLRAQ